MDRDEELRSTLPQLPDDVYSVHEPVDRPAGTSAATPREPKRG